jgi:serine-type D-Ala-D-Ala carboxypeptidase/endopeptidase
MRIGLTVLSFLVIASAPLAAQEGFPSDEVLESMLRYLVEDGETPGIVLGLLEPDGSTRVLAYGSAGPDARSLSPRSVFEIGSVTKTFTATLLGDMVARDIVALDDPVARHLPAEVRVPTFEGREITLLDLATHRSGLPSVPADFAPADLGNPYGDFTVEKLYAWLSGHELRQMPGSEYEYSNLGVGLLGHALARAAGTPFRQLMRERLLQPLGLRMTGFTLDGPVRDWMVRGHGGDRVVPYWFATEAVDAAGGLRSNAPDLLTYLDANLGPPTTPLERAMRTAHEPRRAVGEGADSIGLACSIAEVGGRTIVSHTGSTGGFRTQLAFDPERRLGVVVLANSRAFADELFRDLLLMTPLADRPHVVLERQTLAEFAGEYVSSGGLPLYIRLDENGHLTGQAPNQIRFRLYAASDSSFYARRVPFEMKFRRGADGAVEQLVLGVGGRTNRFVRTGDDVPPPAIAAGNASPSLTESELAIYAGAYVLELGGRTVELRVFGEDGTLMADLGGQAVSALIPRQDHTFTVAMRPADRITFHVQDGRAESLTFVQGEQRITGTRRQFRRGPPNRRQRFDRSRATAAERADANVGPRRESRLRQGDIGGGIAR